MVASPALLLFLDAKSAVVIINSFIAIQLALVLSRTWRHLDLRGHSRADSGRAGVGAGGGVCAHVAEPGLLRIIIGVVIVTLGLLNLREIKLSIATFPGSGVVFGFITCLAVTAISIGGPLAAVYAIAQRWPTQTVGRRWRRCSASPAG